MVVTMLDEVAWLFNLRGSDIDYNPGQCVMCPAIFLTTNIHPTPVFFAYAVITLDTAILFVNRSQLETAVPSALGDSIQIHPYESFFDFLKSLPSQLQLDNDSVRSSRKTFFRKRHRGMKSRQMVIIGDKASLAVAEALGKVRHSVSWNVQTLTARLPRRRTFRILCPRSPI